MGVIGDIVLELVAEAFALTIVLSAVALAVAVVPAVIPPIRWRRQRFAAALGGALVGAALAARLHLPRLWVIPIGRQSVPLAWAAAGAAIAVGVAAAGLVPRRSAAGGSTGSPAEGAAPPQPGRRTPR